MKSEPQKIKALVVDDEPLARRRLARLLEARADVELVAQCRNGRDALAAVEAHTPDLVYLDVQMPQMDGIAFLEALDPEGRPVVVFVTAFDTYALRAFDLHAVDYLLKPYDDERFSLAFERAAERVRAGRVAAGRGDAASDRVLALVEEMVDRQRSPDRIVLRTDRKAVFLRVEDVDWIGAEAKYVRVHANGETYLHRDGIGHLESQLDPIRFLRIHRSTIVNLDRVAEIHDWFHGEYVVVLRDGTRLAMSRRYRPSVSRFLGDRI